MTLTEFLLARIAEDEALARHVWPERFTDRMLAECEAKRRIVEREWDGLSLRPDAFPWYMATLATIYADHPDYREEWKP